MDVLRKEVQKKTRATKNPAPFSAGFCESGVVCCLHAGSSRTCWQGNKDDDDKVLNRRMGGVRGLRQGRVALQHGARETRGPKACQAGVQIFL
jgi:hypothetical protein